MTQKSILITVGVIILLATVGYTYSRPTTSTLPPNSQQTAGQAQNKTPELIALTGTYECLPYLDVAAPKNDCAFGIKTDNGEYYAVNFGASAGSMADFTAGAHITAKGFIILSEHLKPNSWEKFNTKGLFTITEHPSVQ